MKKFIFEIFSIFIFFIVFSCSDSKTAIIVTQADNSLRNQMAHLDNNILWTQNLDNILKEEENAEENYEDSEEFKRLLPHEQREYIRKKEEEKEKNKRKIPEGLQEVAFHERLFYPKNHPPMEPLYPEIIDFGSLDLSLLAPEVEVVIDKFIQGMNEEKLEIDCISPETRFLEPIFLEDFSSIQNIDSYIIGKPIIIQNEYLNEYQVPVRMKCENGYYDSLFFLVNLQDSFFIEQVNYGSLISE